LATTLSDKRSNLAHREKRLTRGSGLQEEAEHGALMRPFSSGPCGVYPAPKAASLGGSFGSAIVRPASYVNDSGNPRGRIGGCPRFCVGRIEDVSPCGACGSASGLKDTEGEQSSATARASMRPTFASPDCDVSAAGRDPPYMTRLTAFQREGEERCWVTAYALSPCLRTESLRVDGP
jgi:hypothetical protein